MIDGWTVHGTVQDVVNARHHLRLRRTTEVRPMVVQFLQSGIDHSLETTMSRLKYQRDQDSPVLHMSFIAQQSLHSKLPVLLSQALSSSPKLSSARLAV
jgi:hypothetical protein